MKREIKFRAWEHDNNGGKLILGYEAFIGEAIEKGYSLMQFTGLHDKNGKEIYEGDKVKTPKGICVVTFELGCFYANIESRYRLGGWTADAIEVIGNIYETPLV
jgi:hypothetical protein